MRDHLIDVFLAHSHQQDWLEWPIWGFVGTCAEVAALGTLFAIFYQWWQSRLRYPPVVWEIGTPAVGVLQNGPQLVGGAYRIHVTNSGRVTGHIRSIYIVNAKVLFAITSPQIQWLVRSAESFDFDVVSDDISKAWIVIVNNNFENGRITRIAWYALQPGSDLANEQVAAYVRSRVRGGLIGWWQKRHPKAVGPGHIGVALISMPHNKIWEIPRFVLEVINGLEDVLLVRPGTIQFGDPKTWAGPPPEFKGLFKKSRPAKSRPTSRDAAPTKDAEPSAASSEPSPPSSETSEPNHP
jgi:hypothetical protein